MALLTRYVVDSHINHHASRLEPIGLHILSLADRSHDYVCTPNMRWKVHCTRMQHSDRGIHRLQQCRDRHSHDVRASNYDSILPCHIYVGALQ